jgi:methionyl-tRNA synthetase
VTRYTVTSALPYANGPIHFGHVAGAYLPADVYVRTLRMRGDEVLFVCGTDEHGVAITLRAEEQGLPYPDYVRRWREEHLQTFRALSIEFDVWSGTSVCPQHAETTQDFFRDLDANGYLVARESEQLYCPKDEMFLADRYVLGTCYECGHEHARGDECPSCGTWIQPLRLIAPRCKVCGSDPERRRTTHWYLDLPKLRDERLGSWIEQHDWKPNVSTFIKNMLADVPQRAITRDMDWGVKLPAGTEGAEGKVLYVWFDAPIGYVSFTKQLLAERGEAPDAWERWWKGDDVRLVHFIGKDNIPFHCLVFPSMLYGAKQDYVLPWAVPANEFYNLRDGKFSTSEGRTIDPATFFETYEREVVRWYIITTLPETADAEFSLEGLVTTNNAELAGNLGNLATRVLKFIAKNFEGRVPPMHEAHRAELDAQILEACGAIGDPALSVEAFRFREAARTLMANASVANVFMQRLEPWALRKTDPEKAASALNTLCQYLAWLARWMVPFMPQKAQALWEMLGLEGQVAAQAWPGAPEAETWRLLEDGHPLGEPHALFPRLEAPAPTG